MMKSYQNGLFSLYLLVVPAQDNLQQKIDKGELFLKTCHESEKGMGFLAISKTYLEKQDLEQAFFSYLSALEYLPNQFLPEMKEEEKKVYDQELKIYCQEGVTDPTATAYKLIEHIEELALAHPNYFHLNMLLATAYANTSKYDLFFDTFYRSYPYLKEHFLAYKTLAALHFRLMQMSKEEERQEIHREMGLHYLQKACEKNAYDPSLYKKLIVLAKEREDHQFLLSYLEKMVECETIMARGDIVFYVQEALNLKREDIAKKILDIAKKEYAYSRACMAAEECVNKWKR